MADEALYGDVFRHGPNWLNRPYFYIMWKIKEVKHATNRQLDHIDLRSDRLRCKVFPQLGGSLQELVVDNIRVIDGITTDEQGLEDYRNSFKSSVLFPFPNRIKDGTFEFGERSYQVGINDLTFNNAIHGLVYDQSFALQEAKDGSGKALVKLKYRADGSHPGFPFEYELMLTYSFADSGEVTLGFEVTNTGYQTFPFGIGWHPYFLSANLSRSLFSMEAQDHFLCTERMIPEEKEAAELNENFEIDGLNFDDGYSLARPYCLFETPEYDLRLDFDNGVESFLQIYTPPHRNSMAIEPMTCITNALNNGIGLKELDPGRQYTWSVSMNVVTKP